MEIEFHDWRCQFEGVKQLRVVQIGTKGVKTNLCVRVCVYVCVYVCVCVHVCVCVNLHLHSTRYVISKVCMVIITK